MRKILIALILFPVAFAANAQAWFENFNNGMPAGWLLYNVDNLTPAGPVSFVNKAWVIRVKQTAQGGTIPGDSVIVSTSFYNPSGTSDDWIVSPPFMVAGSNMWLFWDENAFDYLTPESYEVRLATNGNQPSDFGVVLYNTGNAATGYVTKGVNIGSYNGQTVRVAFRNKGNNKLLLGLDNIGTQIISTIDAAVDSIVFPEIFSGSSPVNVIVKNKGLQTITSLNLQYQVNNGTPVTQNFTGLNIPTFGTAPLTFSTNIATLPSGVSTLTVKVNQVNGVSDQQPSNDSRQISFAVPSQSVQRHCLIEEFSSSTCHPCADQSVWFDSLLLAINANADTGNVDVIKYQMNYPAPGNDVSYNAHSQNRYDYYQVFGLPDHFTEGKRQGAMNAGQLQAEIMNCKTAPSYMKIAGQYLFDNDSVYGTATITPYFSLQGNYSVHMAFVDDHYLNPNTATTQTDFYNVMRKMLNNGNGIHIVSWSDNVPQSFKFHSAYTVGNVAQNGFNFWHVPNQTSLVVFVQNNRTKEVLQSHVFKPVATNIAGVQQPGNLRVFPNPAKQILNVHFLSKGKNSATILLVNYLGQTVYRIQNRNLHDGLNTATLQTASLPAGVYMLLLQTKNESTAIPVMIEN